jgi:hypothetical protein
MLAVADSESAVLVNCHRRKVSMSRSGTPHVDAEMAKNSGDAAVFALGNGGGEWSALVAPVVLKAPLTELARERPRRYGLCWRHHPATVHRAVSFLR